MTSALGPLMMPRVSPSPYCLPLEPPWFLLFSSFSSKVDDVEGLFCLRREEFMGALHSILTKTRPSLRSFDILRGKKGKL